MSQLEAALPRRGVASVASGSFGSSGAKIPVAYLGQNFAAVRRVGEGSDQRQRVETALGNGAVAHNSRHRPDTVLAVGEMPPGSLATPAPLHQHPQHGDKAQRAGVRLRDAGDA